MSKIFIFRHIPCEGPGYLGAFLYRHHIPFEVLKIDEGVPVPDSIDGMAGLVFMGGPMSVNDTLPWIPKELTLIRKAQEEDMPVLGHCLGGQLIAKALGATIAANPVKEIGWLPVQACDGPGARDWLAGLPAQFEAFHWHGETFTIPAGADRILESRNCANQAFVIDKTLALQCHVEMTEEMVKEWAHEYANEIAAPGATVQSEAQMTTKLEDHIRHSQKIADALYTRWIRGLAA